MPHIHTAPNEIDYTADVFVVYRDKVLFRFHDKHKLWLVPGGHIELNELPEQAALREVKEETGLDIVLYQADEVPVFEETRGASAAYQELSRPLFMNIHAVSDTHRHLSLVYAGKAEKDEIIEPEGEEKSGGCIWLTKDELIAHPDIHPSMKRYGLAALELLGSEA
ncbi:MAG: NUDIX domain-containing protein [Candidatus Moraniibacteriota bacterium]